MSAKGLIKNQVPKWRDEVLTLKDGVKLFSRIWLPPGEGPWPALLMRQPYGRELASTITYLHPTWWASNGYLVIVQDVRGQGDSGGVFTGFQQEASDTTRTHKWVRSLPECNGRLGTYGFSYQGLTQLLAEPESPPPDCLAPAMTGLREFEDWSCEGGAFWWHLGIAWGLQLAALKAKRNGSQEIWTELHRSLEEGSYLREGTSLLKRYDPTGMAMQWLKQSTDAAATWLSHVPPKEWLKQPMLLIGGWWDPHLKGILEIYNQSISAGGSPELYIGPATHLDWWEGVNQHQLAFFDCHLKGKSQSNKKVPTNHLWNLTTQKWQTSQNAIETNIASPTNSWGLLSKGMASIDSQDGIMEENSKGNGLVYLVHDPWRPVPSIGGHLSPKPGNAERSSVDNRNDVATFTTKPLKESCKLEGIPTLEIIVSSDQQGFDLCVALSVIKESSYEVNQLSTGILRVLGKEALTAKPRKVLMQPLLASINRGEQIRISIAGAAWPAIGVNPGKDNLPIGAPSSKCLPITLAIELEGSKLIFKSLLSNKEKTS